MNLNIKKLIAVFCCILPLFLTMVINKTEFQTLRTARKILKQCESYRVKRTKTSVVYYTAADKEYVYTVQRVINTYYPLLQKDMNASLEAAVTVIIFPTKKEMYEAISYNGSKSATAMGAYTAGIIAVLSPSVWLGETEAFLPDDFIKNGPVLHELAHFVFDKKTKGNYSPWFSEGTALFYENKYLGYTWKRGTKPGGVTFKQLSNNFKYINEKESYGKSYEIVKYIADTKGEKALKRIYDGLEQNKKLNKLLEKEVTKLSIFDGI